MQSRHFTIMLFFFFLAITPLGSVSYCTHFIDEETEVQRDHVICPKWCYMANNCQGQELKTQIHLTSELILLISRLHTWSCPLYAYTHRHVHTHKHTHTYTYTPFPYYPSKALDMTLGLTSYGLSLLCHLQNGTNNWANFISFSSLSGQLWEPERSLIVIQSCTDVWVQRDSEKEEATKMALALQAKGWQRYGGGLS